MGERTGGWPELSNPLRVEVTNFAAKHVRDLESHARALGKGSFLVKDRTPSTDLSPSSPASPALIAVAQNDWTAGSLLGDFNPDVNSSKSQGVAIGSTPTPQQGAK